MKKYLKKINNYGFTLIELMVVIGIIGLLSSIILTSTNSARAKARDAVRMQDFKEFHKALEIFYATYGVYPCGDWFGDAGGSANIFADGSDSCPFLDGVDLVATHSPSCDGGEQHDMTSENACTTYPKFGLFYEKLYPIRQKRDPLKGVGGYGYLYTASANRQKYLLQTYLEVNTKAMQNDGGLCPTKYEFGPGLGNTDLSGSCP